MPNKFKYNKTGSEANSLFKGNWAIDVTENNLGDGPSSVTGFYNGAEVPTDGWVIYINGTQIPISTDQGLLEYTNSLGGDGSSVSNALVWLNQQNTIMVVNKDYENIVTDGLILNLDAGFLPSYPKSGTTWTDLSGNDNNGTLINGASYANGSITLDGVNDYVDTNLLFNKDDFTYAAWFKRTGDGGSTGMNDIIDSIDNTSQEWARIGVLLGKHSFHVDNDGYKVILEGSTVTNNVWYYIVGVWTKVTGNMKLYVNGVLDAETTHPKRTTIIALNPERIGQIANSAAVSEYFQGEIPVAQVYNKALSADEVLQNFNAQKSRFGL